MNRAAVNRIADAVLYEGYILYPYRPSVKNRQRWTFGGLYPEAWCQAQANGDAALQQTECLITGGTATTFEAVVRFLHLTTRQVGAIDPPLTDWRRDAEPTFRPVEALRVGEQMCHTWQEAEEREVTVGEVSLADLLVGPWSRRFTLAGGRRVEPVRGTDGTIAGVLVRQQQAVEGVIDLSAALLADGLYRVTLRIANRTALGDPRRRSRDEALMAAFVSTHAILGVCQGEFVSLFDPPEEWRDFAAGCRNIGAYPVLVGEEGRKDMMLSSPIILYDYPQVAPESPGNFFDGTEIDEMLSLRIMTMTDEEKHAMAAVDSRAAELLARTEALAREQLLGLHGTLRGLRSVTEEEAHG
jgi:hypothetical protein